MVLQVCQRVNHGQIHETKMLVGPLPLLDEVEHLPSFFMKTHPLFLFAYERDACRVSSPLPERSRKEDEAHFADAKYVDGLSWHSFLA